MADAAEIDANEQRMDEILAQLELDNRVSEPSCPITSSRLLQFMDDDALSHLQLIMHCRLLIWLQSETSEEAQKAASSRKHKTLSISSTVVKGGE
jgi:hypothetical protein